MTDSLGFSEECLSHMDLETIVAFFRLSYFDSQDLQQLTLMLLERHETSECLLELLVEEGYRYEEKRSVFEGFLQEQSIRLPCVQEAMLVVAQYYAQGIINNECTPHQGARKIWFEVCSNLSDPSELLLSFVTAASEIEDLPNVSPDDPIIKQLEDEIRIYAQQLRLIQNPSDLRRKQD